MGIEVRFGSPNKLISFLSLEQSMKNDLQRVLEKAHSEEIRKTIQEILDLDISILTKHLFIYESLVGATEIIKKLHKQQRVKMLEELDKIDTSKYSGRIWMSNHITELCLSN